MADLTGSAALVTGGGSGIGLGGAKRLAADGAHVTIAGRTEEPPRRRGRRDRGAATPGVTVQYAVCDVTVEADVRAAVARATEPTGGLDVLFACAGGSLHLGPIVDADLDAWRATLDLNIVGTFLSIKHAGRDGARTAVARSSPCRRSRATRRTA